MSDDKDWLHERLRWMAFLAGWQAARPDQRVDPAEVDQHYQEWKRNTRQVADA